MSSLAPRLITAEEFAQLPDSERMELVRGEVIESMPPGGEHAEIAGAIVTLLRLWLKHNIGGYTGVEASYLLSRNPDILRVPDVSYVRKDRIPPSGRPKAYWNIPPDLAVEVISPSETGAGIRAKVRDYLAAGTLLVWTVYPDTREVVVHTADGLARTYGENDIIEDANVLPGFSCKVAEIFEELT